MQPAVSCRAVACGCSAGGPEALHVILGGLPADYPLPLLLVQHLHASDAGRFAQQLGLHTALRVVEAEDKQAPQPGQVHVAPAGYHLLVERDGRLALNTDAKVCYSRPSIDVLFESAARAWDSALACVILSGANYDGAAGATLAHRRGALVIAQDPASAAVPVMPQAVIDRQAADLILPPERIAAALLRLAHGRPAEGVIL